MMRNTLSTTAAGWPGGGDVLAGIKRAMEAVKTMPPPLEFYSNSLFSSDRATKFRRPSGADAVIAHRDFWELLPKKQAPIGNPLLEISIIDLDNEANKELCDRINRELMAAFAKHFGSV